MKKRRWGGAFYIYKGRPVIMGLFFLATYIGCQMSEAVSRNLDGVQSSPLHRLKPLIICLTGIKERSELPLTFEIQLPTFGTLCT